jgi:hypothetical protein
VSGSLLEPLEQWRRVAQRATATGGAWIHAPPPMKGTESGESGTSSSSLPPYAGGDLQNNQERSKQLILLFFLFLDLFPPVGSFQICFKVNLSLIYICSFCRWQVWWRRIAVDAGGSAGA